MPDTLFRFAKTLATPTETAWTHVYHAGSVYTVVSLAKDTLKEEETIAGIGKEFLNALEAEFFGLAEKTLPSMKEALQTALKELPEDVRTSLCLAYVKDTVLYVFGIGGGTALLKREDRIGALIKEGEAERSTKEIHSASGFVKPNDTILLITETFAKRISLSDISKACEADTPEEISETFSRMIEDVSDGDVGVLVLTYIPKETDVLEPIPTVVSAHVPHEVKNEDSYQNDETVESSRDDVNHEATSDAEPPEEPAMAGDSPLHSYEHLGHVSRIEKKSPLGAFTSSLQNATTRVRSLPLRKLLLLITAAIILLVLIVTIYKTTSSRQAVKTNSLFTQVYADAQKEYQLGSDLKDLNKPLAQDDFRKAKKIISDNKSKFKDGSDEATKLADLEKKIDAELSGAASVHTVEATTVEDSASDVLAAEKAQSASVTATKDSTTIYTMTKSEIFKGDKSIIKAGSDWSAPVGFAVYNGNVYVLDQKNGVMKYSAGGDGYGKSTYFKDTPSMTKAMSIAIDSDVWILLSDSIQKYTKGSQDPFGVLGIDKAFNNPTKIVTNADTANLYILDKGNARIVKIKKDGTFLAQYAASILGSAKDFDVDEKANTAYILSGSKVYKISLQ